MADDILRTDVKIDKIEKRINSDMNQLDNQYVQIRDYQRNNKNTYERINEAQVKALKEASEDCQSKIKEFLREVVQKKFVDNVA